MLTETGDHVRVFPILNAAQCDDVIEVGRLTDRWMPTRIFERSFLGRTTFLSTGPSTVLRDPNSPILMQIREIMQMRFRSVCEGVRGGMHVSAQEIYCQARGYAELPHADITDMMDDRIFSIVCNLNADFIGGDVYFPNLGFAYRGAPGQALIFPSRYEYCTHPILSGERFILRFFLNQGLNDG